MLVEKPGFLRNLNIWYEALPVYLLDKSPQHRYFKRAEKGKKPSIIRRLTPFKTMREFR